MSAYAEGPFDPWTDDPQTVERQNREKLKLSEALEHFIEDTSQAGRAERTLENC